MSALARWCARRRRTVVGAWIALVLTLGALALGLGAQFTDATTMPDSESGTAYALLADAGLSSSGTSGTLVWHATDVTAPAVVDEVTSALDQITRLPGVESVTGPYDATGATQLNADTGTAYAAVQLSSDTSVGKIDDIAAELQREGLEVATGGTAFAPEIGAGGAVEGVGVLAALVILLVVLRSVWAGLLPIVTGVSGVVTSLLTLVLLSHVVNLSSNTITMGSLVGLGVGIDYALFIVNRHRKALLAGKSVQEAVEEAVNTSGRAVVFAGATVVIALLGVFVVGIDVLTGMARGAALTVVLTVAAAVTLLPGLLSLLGTRVLSKRQRRELSAGPVVEVAGAGARWSGLVQRAPRRLAALGLVAMVVLALPALSLRLGSADASSDPADSATHRYHALMAEGFGEGFDASLLLVAQTPDDAARQAFADLDARLGSVADVASVGPVVTGTDPAVSLITLTPSSSAQTEETADLVESLRDNVIPSSENGSNLQVHVGGSTASSIDSAQGTLSKLPLFLALVAVLGFVLLVVAFRSVVVPLVGALGNLLTLAVGLGVLVAAFQHGLLAPALGVGSASPIESLVPVMVIGIMFGLSMDYQVFLVSRMHEEWHLTRDNSRAVRVGLAETSRVIVTAAAIMFCVFAAFGFAGQRIVAEIGVGLALAVLADAFVLRLTVVPALMHLVGRANWWYPRWAERVTPKFSVEAVPAG